MQICRVQERLQEELQPKRSLQEAHRLEAIHLHPLLEDLHLKWQSRPSPEKCSQSSSKCSKSTHVDWHFALAQPKIEYCER